MSKDDSITWETHWKGLNQSTFGRICSFYRINIIANAVAHYLDKYFPYEGVFVECGSGTSQTTIKLNKRNRRIVALDISKEALNKAKKVAQIDECKLGNIFSLPFKDACIDGIWNLGVMEHFTIGDINRAMKEFSRVLKDGSHAVLFWPPKYGPVNIGVSVIEFFANRVMKKGIDLFPDEINQFSGKLQINKLAEECGFSDVKVEHSVRDLFTHAIVILKK